MPMESKRGGPSWPPRARLCVFKWGGTKFLDIEAHQDMAGEHRGRDRKKKGVAEVWEDASERKD